MVRAFGIGFAPGEWRRLCQVLVDRGIPEEIALKAGLLGRSERGAYDWLRNRVTFPIIDVRGRVVGFGGRIIEGDGPEIPQYRRVACLLQATAAVRASPR